MVSTELLVTNLLFGLVSSFSPCLFPLMPSYLATQVKMKQSKMISFFSSLAVIAGILVVFLSIGLLFDLLSTWMINNYAIIARIQAVIIILAGIMLIKPPAFMYKIRLPEFVENFIYNDERGTNSIIFSFILGLVYTIIAAPCAGALFFPVLLGLIGQSFGDIFLLVLFFSIGAGIPFLAMSLFVDDLRPETIGKIHSTSSKVLMFIGFALILAGIYLFWDVSKVFFT